LDGDGNLDIVFTYYGGKVHAIKHDGTPLPGWPVSLPYTDTGIRTRGGVSVGDIDGDGKPDVLVNDGEGGSITAISAFNYRGEKIPGWPYLVNPTAAAPKSYAQGAAIIADINRDNKAEVVFSYVRYKSAPHQDLGAEIQVLDPRAPYNASSMPWPMFQHDPQRSGKYGRPGYTPNQRPSYSNSVQPVSGSNRNGWFYFL
jgi:hypothetical protein